jgi:Stage II sporulation protein E (SpoIIE)
MARRPVTIPGELLETFQSLLIAGRWLLVVAETIVMLLLLITERLGQRAHMALLFLFLYNATSLVVVHRVPIRRLPVIGLLFLDLLFVAAVAHHTGGSQSPFLGQCYLIIFAAAFFYGLAGGVAVGVLSVLITSVLVIQTPAGLWEDVRDLAPYFLMTGAVTGFLVDRLRIWFERYQQSEAHSRERDLQAEATRREMELARSIQEAALPAAPPRVPGLDIAARSTFAREVGGDFYLFVTDGERVGLTIGDVSGKGMSAALTATSIGHLLPWLRPLRDPRRALSELNQELTERLPDQAFVTMTLAQADLMQGRVCLWTAGHPPALLWRHKSAQVVETRVQNPLLGVFPTWEGSAEEWPLEAGDALVLYSDGLIETRNARGEEFDLCRAASLLAQHAHESAEEIVDALTEAMHRWGTPTDDLTILVCRRIPTD